MGSVLKHLLTAVVALASFPLLAALETTQSLEVRFCPASAVWAYPLESQRELQSLLLQNVAVINHGSARFNIDHIDIELLRPHRY